MVEYVRIYNECCEVGNGRYDIFDKFLGEIVVMDCVFLFDDGVNIISVDEGLDYESNVVDRDEV